MMANAAIGRLSKRGERSRFSLTSECELNRRITKLVNLLLRIAIYINYVQHTFRINSIVYSCPIRSTCIRFCCDWLVSIAWAWSLKANQRC
jgi:hypothetical protein